MNTVEDLCGVSGPGNGPGGRGCNLFNPGVFNPGGRVPVYALYEAGRPGYRTDYDNFAPNVGVAWQPQVQSGWLRASARRPESRDAAGELRRGLQQRRAVLLQGRLQRQPGQHGVDDPFGDERAVPARAARADVAGAAARAEPPWRVPGIPTEPDLPDGGQLQQRRQSVRPGLPNATGPVVLVRAAAGARPAHGGRSPLRRHAARRRRDHGELERPAMFTSNGFLDEFRLAQQNLQVAIAQGCGQTGRPACSFAYQGPGTGTHPLPIYLANFVGAPRAQAGDPARYTGTNWSNTARLDELAARNPNPGGAANALFSNAAFRASLEAAGLPRNFFVLNPDVEQRQHQDQRRFHEIRLTAGQLPPAPVRRIGAGRQLHVRPALRVHARRSAPPAARS